jgi:hypothetical protein
MIFREVDANELAAWRTKPRDWSNCAHTVKRAGPGELAVGLE